VKPREREQADDVEHPSAPNGFAGLFRERVDQALCQRRKRHGRDRIVGRREQARGSISNRTRSRSACVSSTLCGPSQVS
jgi:hypothetical protein